MALGRELFYILIFPFIYAGKRAGGASYVFNVRGLWVIDLLSLCKKGIILFKVTAMHELHVQAGLP